MSNSLNDELTQLIHKKGGLFPIETQPGSRQYDLLWVNAQRFKRHTEYAASQLYSAKQRLVDFGFINATELNAFAYASKEPPLFDFIGINVGALFTIVDVFRRMLSHPDTFPEVGNPQIESADRTHIPYLSADVISSNYGPLFPVCHTRAHFANFLSQIATDFLFFHELTHLRNGHLEFVMKKLSLNEWIESVGNTTASQLHTEIRQALEWDADCGAVVLSLNGVMSLFDRLEQNGAKNAAPEILHALRAGFGSRQLAAKSLLFACYVFFRIFDGGEWGWKEQAKRTHPNTPYRSYTVALTMHELFRTRAAYNYDADAFVSEHTEVILAAEVACARIRNDEPDLAGIRSVFREERYIKYTAQLDATWKLIRPQLEEHKRGGNLPA